VKVFAYAAPTRRYPLQTVLELLHDRVYSAIPRSHYVEIWGADIATMQPELGLIRALHRKYAPDHVWIIGRKESAAQGLALRGYYQPLDSRQPAVLGIPHPAPGPHWGKPENAELWAEFIRAHPT